MRSRHKIGDIFEVSIGDGTVGYFQYIAIDHSQLSSAVIRGFVGTYNTDNAPAIDALIASQIHFHAHVFLKAGYTLEIWRKIGSAPPPPILDVIFRNSADYGNPEIQISHDWYIWRANEPFQDVGPLPHQYQSSEIGIVVAPQDVAERMRSGSYRMVYPKF
ncbi:MAG: hypothetical protein V4586_03415 [Pseudomonadota bacterium]